MLPELCHMCIEMTSDTRAVPIDEQIVCWIVHKMHEFDARRSAKAFALRLDFDTQRLRPRRAEDEENPRRGVTVSSRRGGAPPPVKKSCTISFSRIAAYAEREQLQNADRARGRQPDVPDFQPAGASERRLRRDRPPPVFDENSAREPAPPRGRPVREGRRRRGARAVGREEQCAEGDLVRAGSCP